MPLRKSHPPNSRRLVYAMRLESAGGPHRFSPHTRGTDRKLAPRPYDESRLVDLGHWSEPICEAAPSNLGPQQLGGFFPVAASVFQIQSVFVPTHEPLLVRWPFRSNHSAYLRGKMRHLLCPQSVVNGCLAGFLLMRNTEPLIRGKRSIRHKVEKYY